MKDNIFAAKITKASDFVFDERVAAVFEDMLKRSIPGYGAIINMIKTLTARFAQKNSNLYDVGCSLGAASLSMLEGLRVGGCKIIALDTSEAMIKRCKQLVLKPSCGAQIEFRLEDALNASYSNASVAVLNFTLQFIDKQKRDGLLKRIADNMLEGGVLILSEKVKFADDNVNALLIDVYHAFKKANGYSDLEISQKRSALENVLIPETISEHKNRLIRAGFKSADVWFQCFNFMSMIAIK